MTTKLSEKFVIHNVFEGKSKLNFPISKVKGIAPEVLNVVTFQDLLNEMQHADSLELSNKLSEAYKSDPTLYKQLKENLNGFVMGEFTKRTDKDCLCYVPLLVFDIDGYEDPIFTEFDLSRLHQNDYVFAAFPSPSKHGLRILIWADVTPETHKAVYISICEHLSDFLNMGTDKKQKPHIDTSTQNISRLWFYTYVPSESLYLNTDSLVFSATPQNKDLYKTILRPQEQQDIICDSDIITACQTMLKKRKIPQGRNNEVFCLACLLNEHGLSENAILEHCLTYTETDFDEKEVNKTVDSALKRSQHAKFSTNQVQRFIENKTTLNGTKTIISTPSVSEPKAEEIKDENDDSVYSDEKMPKVTLLKNYLNRTKDLRFNEVAFKVEISKKGKNQFEKLKFENLYIEILEKSKLNGIREMLESLLNSDFIPRYNPIKSYLISLREWDETQPDYISQLSNYIKAKNEYWFKEQFKKMLVRTLACATGEVKFNKQCFTLVGKQNDGKTSFVRFLCPPQLKEHFKENLNLEHKDSLFALARNFIINLDELASFSRKDLNMAKSYFTLGEFQEREHFGKWDESYTRIASFFASTNKSDFLTDETGSVRWLIMEIEGINFNYRQEINIDLVWSQAYALLKNGFEYEITKEEIAYSEKNNKRFNQISYEMELIQQHFEVCNKEEFDLYASAAVIKDELEVGTNRKLTFEKIGKALKMLGFEFERKYDKEKRNTINGYYLKRIKN